MLKKLTMVGAMSVVMPGTLNQLVLAIIIVLCFQTALLVAQPYKKVEDDMTALATGFALVMFFFFTLVLKFQTLTEEVADSLTGRLAHDFAINHEQHTLLLLLSTLGALLLGGAMIVVELSAEAVVEAQASRARQQLEKEVEELRRRERASVEEAEAMRRVLAEEQLPDVMVRCRIDASQISYEGGRKLGAGAFGEVWAAALNGTPVAVKKLHRNKIDEAGLKAFRAEFELQLSLRHPNIVQVRPAATPFPIPRPRTRRQRKHHNSPINPAQPHAQGLDDRAGHWRLLEPRGRQRVHRTRGVREGDAAVGPRSRRAGEAADANVGKA